MLIEFTIGNFRSFKDRATLSMVAANTKARDPQVNENNTVATTDNLTLLTSMAIYGANASGKSNLIKALIFMRRLVLYSSKTTQTDEEIDVTPFRLNIVNEKKPSFFEMAFRLNEITYRYGFEVNSKKIVSEWLFYSPYGREIRLFIRDGEDIKLSKDFKSDNAVKKLTRPNALFLSVASQFNSEIASAVLGWFRSIGVISGLDDMGYRGFTARKFSEDEKYRSEILSLIRSSDIDIDNVIAEKGKMSESLPQNIPQELREFLITQNKGSDDIVNLRTTHKRFDAKGIPVSSIEFDLGDESEGTQKLFHMSGPIVDVLTNGKVLVVDEIEARLHTFLTRKLIQLFNSQTTNPKRAQLIFATHDTNLLSNKLFRRDQIWFVEKDSQSASHLYSLAELKVRNDASFENDYLQGIYGAVPMFEEMRQILVDINRDEKNDAE